MKMFIGWFIYAVFFSYFGLYTAYNYPWSIFDKQSFAFIVTIGWILSFATLVAQTCLHTGSSTFKAFNGETTFAPVTQRPA